jgi:hypothetical protein
MGRAAAGVTATASATAFVLLSRARHRIGRQRQGGGREQERLEGHFVSFAPTIAAAREARRAVR